MNEETLMQAYQWFKEKGFQVDVDVDNLCLYLTVWNTPLDDCADILLSASEIEYRADLYKNSNK